jgi:hypothetical protein
VINCISEGSDLQICEFAPRTARCGCARLPFLVALSVAMSEADGRSAQKQSHILEERSTANRKSDVTKFAD